MGNAILSNLWKTSALNEAIPETISLTTKTVSRLSGRRSNVAAGGSGTYHCVFSDPEHGMHVFADTDRIEEPDLKTQLDRLYEDEKDSDVCIGVGVEAIDC
jgi:hypothetical protein